MVIEDDARGCELRTTGRGEEAVVADLGESAWQGVLKEAGDEALHGQGAGASLVGAGVAVAEDDVVAVIGHDALVGDCDAMDVAREVGGDAGAVAGVLDVDDPGFGPGVGGHVIGEFSEGTVHPRTEEPGQGEAGDEEARVGRPAPGIAVETASGDQDVDMGVVEHRPGPCVEHGDHAEASADVAVVLGEKLETDCCLVHEKVIDAPLVPASQGAQRLGQREGDEVVGTRQENTLERDEPTSGAVSVTGWTVTVSTRMAGEMGVATAVAAELAGAQGRGATVGDVRKRAPVRRQHAVAECRSVGIASGAEDRAECDHRLAPGDAVDSVLGGPFKLASEVGVDLRRAKTRVAQVFLHYSQAHSQLEQVGRVAVA